MVVDIFNLVAVNYYPCIGKMFLKSPKHPLRYLFKMEMEIFDEVLLHIQVVNMRLNVASGILN